MKKCLKCIYVFFERIAKTFVSIVCVLLFSKFLNIGLRSLKKEYAGYNDRVLILCNGPSLGNSLNEDIKYFQSFPKVVVNNFYHSDLLISLKPQFHIICDPAYFRDGVVYANQDEITSFVNFLNTVNWNMNLLVPFEFKYSKLRRRINNHFIKFQYLNLTPIDGFVSIRNWLYSKNLGMPIAMNVLIPAIYSVINMDFKNIEIYGADYSWSKDIRVNKFNQTCMKDHHFYDKEDNLRVMPGFDMAHLFSNFAIAFNCHKILQRYAEYRNVNILNCTPNSFIDSYKRREEC